MIERVICLLAAFGSLGYAMVVGRGGWPAAAIAFIALIVWLMLLATSQKR